jgi:peptidoglycan/xylan/chitin deacetylase (PgdA/CDA1 family)
MQEIIPFSIKIGARGDRGLFPVYASAGDSSAESTLDLPEELILLGEDLLQPNAVIPAEDFEAIGRILGHALFTPRLRGLLLEQARAAAQQQARLQLQMQIGVPELAALPWEWMAIGAGKPWIPALREEYTLVRIGRQAQPAAPIVVPGPLRILAVGGPEQDAQLEALNNAMRPMVREGLLALDTLKDASLRSLSRTLASKQYHIVHLAVPAVLTEEEQLVLDFEQRIDGFDLADLLGDIPTLRLVVLTGDQGDGRSLCYAPALLGAVLMSDNVPAALAYTTPLSADAAAHFAATVYNELAEGTSLDLAVTSGRRALLAVGETTWGGPQLRSLPGANQLFVFRAAPPGMFGGLRRFLLPAIAAFLLLILFLAIRFSSQPTPLQPGLSRTPTSEQDQFILPNIPAILPSATATDTLPSPEALPAARSYLTHTIAQSDTLELIAEQYGSAASGIALLNTVSLTEPLRIGRALVVPVHREGAAPDLGGQLINRGNPTQPLVALTFDVEIDDKSIYSILETLRARSIKATFFVTGLWVEAYPDAARAIVRDGHELANHSYTHPYFSRIDYTGAQQELDATERIVREVTGETTRPYFRFPYGDSTSDMLGLVARSGYISYHWSTDEGGFVAWAEQAQANPGEAQGAIVLMHARDDTANALPGWLDLIAATGLRVTTLGEVLR